MDRRTFLKKIGATAVGAYLVTMFPGVFASAAPSTITSVASGSWSDSNIWNPRRVPSSSDIVGVLHAVTLGADATVRGVNIEAAGNLTFSASNNTTRTLTIDCTTNTAGVVVRGRLTMRPAAASQVHVLRFTNVSESRFVGGGMVPLDTDPGVWVVGAGVLDAVGTSKTSWALAAGTIAKNQSQVTLSSAPIGWQVGDTIAIAPTEPPTIYAWYMHYDERTITAINGSTITVSSPLTYDHVSTALWTGVTETAEVLNLSRNVRIEGQDATHRAHVFFSTTARQTVQHAAIRYTCPRKGTSNVLGRYSLHFHMNGDASSGSLIENVVVRNGGSHSFVPHESNGITFRNCIAHDVFDDAYWWDEGTKSNNTLYDRCIASKVGSPATNYTLAGFNLLDGTGNGAVSCRAFGVTELRNASGFKWPTGIGQTGGVWLFEDNVAHSNQACGIFVWQNTGDLHPITRFRAYKCGGPGINHGSYQNAYRYSDSYLYGNRGGGIAILALDKGVPGLTLTFDSMRIDAGGLSPYCITTGKHSLANGGEPVQITNCQFKGATSACIGFQSALNAEAIDVRNCTYNGLKEFYFDPVGLNGSVVRVQGTLNAGSPGDGTIQLQENVSSNPGTVYAPWNARWVNIGTF